MTGSPRTPEPCLENSESAEQPVRDPGDINTIDDIGNRAIQSWIFALLICMFLLVAGSTLYFAKPFLMPVAVAFVLSVLLAPAMAMIEKTGLPSGIAALGLVGALCAGIYFGFSFIAQPAASWAENAPQYIEQASDKLSGVKQPISSVQSLSEEVKQMASVSQRETADEVVVRAPGLAESLTSSMGRAAVQTLFVLALTYFILATRTELRLKLIAARRSISGKLHTARMFRDVERSVGSYIFTMALINAGLGVAVGLAMYFLDMPRPVMWGGIAAALNFIPYIGPIITASLLALVGIINTETLTEAAIPPLVYLGLNFIEGSFVTPLTLGARLTLNPLAILLTVSFWTWLWGPVGALISVPLLVMLKALSAHTEMLHPFSLLLGGTIPRPRKHGWARKKPRL